MPRVYKPNPRGKQYRKYDDDLLKEAAEFYQSNKMSLKVVAEKFNIDKSVLYRHSKKTMKKHGGQPILCEDTEMHMIKYINICAEWGYPLDALDLRYIVKAYLDKAGRTVLKFKNNLPGPDFVSSFLKRHKDQISQRYSQNIKKKRAEVSPETIKEYFKELNISIAGVDPCNILNYDETNLTDDPGRKKIITKRGTKYPERVMNSSKASTSLMIAATADGTLLAPYVVYKAQNLYDTWTEQGPKGARYNRSQSGWFDAISFEDWIKTIVLPYFKDNEGRKILIGDNLSSHISIDVIKMCHEQNISFVFLPPNSTHLTQPLDVAFFRPMKIAWRNIVLKWKKTDGKKQATIPKGCFPRLLKKLMENLHDHSKDNITAGFRKTGIHPIDEKQVLSRLPNEDNKERDESAVEKSVLDLLKEMRYGTMNITEPKRKRKLEIIPGKSVCSTDSENYLETEEDNKDNDKENTKVTKINKQENKKNKGKGKGKKTKVESCEINKEDTTDLPLNIIDNQKTTQSEFENITFSEIDKLDFMDIDSMPIVYDDVILCGNEVVIDNRQTDSENHKRMDMTHHENNANTEQERGIDIFEDVLLCGNEVVIDNRQTDSENHEGMDMTFQENNANKKQEKGIQILGDEKLSDIIAQKKVNLKKCKKIQPNTYVKISRKSSDSNQPSMSGLQNISKRRPSYYRSKDEIIEDLMNDDV